MPKEKVHVPVVEPKSTPFLEYVELGRTVTPNPVFKRDEIHLQKRLIPNKHGIIVFLGVKKSKM